MLGAIAGDIIGSVYEWDNIKTKDFELFSPASRFTDDSILTIALGETILDDADFGQVMRRYYQKYPDAGYGSSFIDWALAPESKPYCSWGNGSAMRTSTVGHAFDTLDQVLEKAEYFASFTHDHPEGIKGAQATSAAIFFARNGISKAEIKSYISEQFKYDLSKSLNHIRPEYEFDVSCQGTVPQAITAFLESESYEDAIRNAISIGGDSDTLACIAGSIAEAFYGGVPADIEKKAIDKLDEGLQSVINRFYKKFMPTPVRSDE